MVSAPINLPPGGTFGGRASPGSERAPTQCFLRIAPFKFQPRTVFYQRNVYSSSHFDLSASGFRTQSGRPNHFEREYIIFRVLVNLTNQSAIRSTRGEIRYYSPTNGAHLGIGDWVFSCASLPNNPNRRGEHPPPGWYRLA